MAIPSGYSLLGRIGYNDRGVYTESSDYVRGDVVYHEGSSYVALTTVTGVTPADDNTNWKYLARGFGATELSEIDATDTSGFAGDAGKKVKGQTLIDKIAEYVMSKVVATDSFQTYLQKFLVDNCVTERSDLSLSAAQGKVLQDQLATLNSNLGHFQYAVIKSKQSHTFNVNATCWFVLHGNTDQNGSLFAGDVRGRLYTLCGGDSSTNVLVSYDDGKLTITNNINWAEVFIVFG